jgi:cytoskeleton protein RodZ
MTETEQGRLLLPGQRLRSGREAAGLTQAEVATRMHLSVSYIRALEADDYDRLPKAAFVRGYIKNYAKLVNLPGDELANLYQQMAEEARPQPMLPPPAKEPDRRLWWIGGTIGFVLIVWLLWPVSIEQPARQTEQPVIPEVSEGVTAEEADLVPAESVDEGGEILQQDDPATTLQTEEDSASFRQEVETDVAAAGSDRLLIRFKEVCWLRVRNADGDEIYVGQRDENQPLQLDGRGPFRVTLGNAAAVSEIFVNDASVRVPVVAPGQVITVRAP